MEKNVDYYHLYSKYKSKYLKLQKQTGGMKKNTSVTTLIIRMSTKNNQTRDDKRRISLTQHFNKVGHGCIFLGSSSSMGGDTRLRILLSAQYRYAVGNTTLSLLNFGGKSEPGEDTITTVIREAIEEIFNFEPSSAILNQIKEYLLKDDILDLFYIIQGGTGSCTYIFDVSILGNFIHIICKNEPGKKIKLPVPNPPQGPVVSKQINLIDYLDTRKYLDFSSVDPDPTKAQAMPAGTNKNLSILLEKFMEDRVLTEPHFKPGLNEVKFLSFSNFGSLYAEINNPDYHLKNSSTGLREPIPIKDYMKNQIIKLHSLIMSL